MDIPLCREPARGGISFLWLVVCLWLFGEMIGDKRVDHASNFRLRQCGYLFFIMYGKDRN
jgi:hypothetical protein